MAGSKVQADALAAVVRNTVATHQLLAKGARVVVAVSGGPDSVALLHLLLELRPLLELQLVAVYVDHGLRPGATTKEAHYVRCLAERFAIGHEIIAVAVEQRARRQKQSLEEAARELRYEALRGVAARLGGAVIAVAHSADDQAEEILLKLLRGSGRRGLAGMSYKNRDIIRPLLDIPKSCLLEYLHSRQIVYFEDATNADPKFLRNRVRHELLPFLETRFDPGARKALRKSAAILAEDESLLEELTEAAWLRVVTWQPGEQGPGAIVARREFAALHPALQRRLVEQLLWRLGSRASYEHIMTVVAAAHRGVNGGELHLKQGLRVEIERHVLRFSYPHGQGAWRGRLRGHPVSRG